jgi:ribosomal protein S12 methylthiotransferase accessory factor
MRIALDSIEDPDCREVLALYEAANLQVAVWHQATQCGIPCFKAGIMDTRGQQTRSPRANYGAGCHPVRSIALVRALTEAAQSRLTVIAGSRDDLNRSRYEQTENPDVVRETRAAFAEPDSMADFDEIESFPAQTFSEDIDLLLGRLRATGSPSVIMVNLTLPGVDVAVVRIVIPGLSLTLPSH